MTDNSKRAVAESSFKPIIAPLGMTNPDGGDKAEYATPEASGLESGFYVGNRGLPWHIALSRRLDTPELMAEADGLLRAKPALELAGLDWAVEKVPVGAMVGRTASRHPKWAKVPGTFAVVRRDTDAVLGIVKKGYQPVQNLAAFEFADALVDSGDAHYETAGSLYGGQQVFLSMEVPDEIHVEGDPSDYRLFLVLSNGHDGRHALEAMVTVERVYCRNTLRIASAGAISSWKIRHTASVDGRMLQARQALGLSFRYAEQFAETASDLTGLTLAERQVESILRDVFPVPERDDKPERIDKSTFGKVLALYHTSPSVEPLRGTGYGVLNAVTEFLDHEAVYRGRTSSAEDTKASGLMFGGADSKKQKAVAVLVGVAAER